MAVEDIWESADTIALIEEMMTLDSQSKRKVYQTYLTLDSNGKRCTFLTTSEDVQLGLSELSYQGQQRLANIIIRGLETANKGSGLLFIPDDEDDDGILATISCVEDEFTIHLSPVD